MAYETDTKMSSVCQIFFFTPYIKGTVIASDLVINTQHNWSCS